MRAVHELSLEYFLLCCSEEHQALFIWDRPNTTNICSQELINHLTILFCCDSDFQRERSNSNNSVSSYDADIGGVWVKRINNQGVGCGEELSRVLKQ